MSGCPHDHSISIVDRSGSYRYVAACECGWRSIAHVSVEAGDGKRRDMVVSARAARIEDSMPTTEEHAAALAVLAEHALPEGAPGAWIRDAIRLMLAKGATS